MLGPKNAEVKGKRGILVEDLHLEVVFPSSFLFLPFAFEPSLGQWGWLKIGQQHQPSSLQSLIPNYKRKYIFLKGCYQFHTFCRKQYHAGTAPCLRDLQDKVKQKKKQTHTNHRRVDGLSTDGRAQGPGVKIQI